MVLFARSALLALLLLSAITIARGEGGPPLLAPTRPFRWEPFLAPRGPVLVVVSLSAQELYVYRNGIRIGASRVSTGRAGYETPAGIYTILQKEREHYSSKYDNAPMPYMQRLTWSGVAIHGGRLPGYPASHGCIRLPAAFASILYSATDTATTLVVVEAYQAPHFLRSNGSYLGSDAIGDFEGMHAQSYWQPDASKQGPLGIVVSAHDQQVVVMRNGKEIGRAPAVFTQPMPPGTRAFMLLEGVEDEPSPMVEGRLARRWIALDGVRSNQADTSPAMAPAGYPSIPQDFARRLYDELVPGTTLIVTDEPLVAPESVMRILQSDPE